MVPGEGKQPSLAMIVGEAPGKDEVREGRPFVGRSGGLLTSALQAVGISRDECYITNAVKEIPLTEDGKIRKPTEGEIVEWRPILQGEIESTAPAAILVLGRSAQWALMPYIPVGEIPFGSIIGHYHLAWHPAYVLRSGWFGQSANNSRANEWIEQLRPWAEAVRRAG